MLTNNSNILHVLKIFIFAISVYIVHYFLYYYVFPETLYAPKILDAHFFIFGITFVPHIVILLFSKKMKYRTLMYICLYVSVIKMFLTVLYLFPILKKDNIFQKEYIMQFFMIYFIYLMLEVIYLVRSLKKMKTKE